METITKFPSKLGSCDLDNQLSSTNLTIPQTYKSSVQFVNEDNTFYDVTLNYNTSSTVSDVFLKECIFNVKKNYTNALYTKLINIYFTLKSIITGTLVLDAGLNKILDIKFETLGAKILYVPLELTSRVVNGETKTVVSVDYTPLGINGEYYYRHTAILSANLLNAQVEAFPTFYSNNLESKNISRNHIYSLKIYPNKSFELIQNNWGIMTPSQNFYSDFTIYNNMEKWINHNTYDDAISYKPFFITPKFYTSVDGYTQESGLFHMMSGNIFISQDPDALYSLKFEILMTHTPNTDLYTFPSSKSATPTSSQLTTEVQTDPHIICKSKIGNLSGAYNYRFNDFDVKGKVSEISISNTLGYQIGYRLIQYAGFKSYTSESAFDKTSLDYVYFSVDDYNNSYLNHNYGVLPNQNILDENILAIVTIRSPQFTTTFDNGSDYIPKLRYYFTPVNIKKIAIKLLDPLGNLVNINTNDYSFVLEVTKLMDIIKT
jgi:hypothetical protein